ncbi:hypothetical protein BgAZ_400500 [Babesia gibsoni]|uniref:MI domain-containing protein n=1 Tax=Babesia gibsoni TaxID=33632 RepID=A0AAD8P7Y3_BABGI|nr:hypothetical protein BgAZ_400500 [Babesia gibsoni]
MKGCKSHKDHDDDPRYTTKMVVSRKAIRRAERKSAKQKHHRNLIEWKQNRTRHLSASAAENERTALRKRSRDEAEATATSTGSNSKEKTYDELEMEYLEQMLTKNKRGINKGDDLFTALRSEFLNDGFDDDFLDFLSSINNLEKGSKRATSKQLSKTGREGLSEDPPYCGSDDASEGEDDQEETDTYDYYNDDASVEDYGEAESGEEEQQDVLSAVGDKETAEDNYKLVDQLIGDLCTSIKKMAIENENSVISLVAIHTTLICALSNTIGINVGYVYCHMLMETMEGSLATLHVNDDSQKLTEAKLYVRNCMLSFAVMSHFEMLDIEVIYYCIRRLSEKEITDHIAQILLLVLRHTGHKMKTHNQASFNAVLDHFGKLLENYKNKHGDISQSRLRFFEQEIQSFKLSKERAPFETYEFLGNYLKGEFRHQSGNSNPQIEKQTLMQFSKKFVSSDKSTHSILREWNTAALFHLRTSEEDDTGITEQLLRKAKAMKLYSNVEKSTFIAIAECISPDHAVERIMDLGFRITQYTKVIYTLVKMMICEKVYNEFYAELAKKLARLPSKTGKAFKRATVCSVISFIDHVHERRPLKAANLGRFVGELVISDVLEFRMLRFLKAEFIDTTSSEAFLSSFFGYLVTAAGPEDEERLIVGLMDMKKEELFDALTSSWEDFLEEYCKERLNKRGGSTVLLEEFGQIMRKMA